VETARPADRGYAIRVTCFVPQFNVADRATQTAAYRNAMLTIEGATVWISTRIWALFEPLFTRYCRESLQNGRR